MLAAPRLVRAQTCPAPVASPVDTPLPDPDFSKLRADDPFIVGVRPHRHGGVCLKVEKKAETASGAKYLIHNYGHGGAGITLSLGCASIVGDHVQQILDEIAGKPAQEKSTLDKSPQDKPAQDNPSQDQQAQDKPAPDKPAQDKTAPAVAVVGSGVIGLTVAAELRRRWPQLAITIHAKDFDLTRTTSFKAGGQFEPSGIFDEYRTPEQKKTLAEYLRKSRDRIAELQKSGDSTRYGIAPIKDYTLDHENRAFDEATPCDVIPRFAKRKLPFGKLNGAGREYATWLINPTILLPALVAELKAHEVRFEERTFADEHDLLTLTQPIVVNCTGYGAKALLKDPAMVAKRGHLAILQKTDERQFYFFSGGCADQTIAYVFCRQHDIVVGGTIHDGDDSETLTDHDQEVCRQLLKNAQALFEGRTGACVRA